MQRFKVEIYSSSKRKEWNLFVSHSNSDTFLFSRDFMEYHMDRFLDYSLMIYDESKLVALLPANRIEDILYSHQGLTYGGLVCHHLLKTSETIFIWGRILQFLNEKSISVIHLKELPFVYLKNATNNPLFYILFKLKAENVRTDMHSVLDLKNYKLSNSRKEGLKRGRKAGLRVMETTSFDLFWDTILIPNLKVKHQVKPVHSVEEMELLKSRFPQNIRQFNVYDGNHIVAGTTIFEMENIVHCQYISGDERKNSIGSLDFLHVHLVTNEFQNKKYFSFGTSNFNAGENVNLGLQFWKEGFGARSIAQAFFKIQTKNYQLLEDVML